MSVLRVGHKGAAHLAPGNTIEAFEAAVACGVDMLEFDVLPERLDGTGALLLAHDPRDLAARRDTVLTLEEGLDHLAQTGLRLDVDLKLPGYEARVLDALRERGLAGRALVSTMEPASLLAVRRLAPDVALGWSVPRARRNPLDHPLTRPLGRAAVQVLRRRMPAQLAAALRDRRVDAVMSHFELVTPRMVDAVLGAGGELFVWTVDDAQRIAELEAMGVSGIITNDPRLFDGGR
jgi:glycerophosphoryl diester phosphodiesterase